MSTEYKPHTSDRKRLMVALADAKSLLKMEAYLEFCTNKTRYQALQTLRNACECFENNLELSDLPLLLFFEDLEEEEKRPEAKVLFQGPHTHCIHFLSIPIEVMQRRLPEGVIYPFALKILHEAFTNPRRFMTEDSNFGTLHLCA